MEQHLDKMMGQTSFFLRNKTDDFILLDMGITQASQMDFIWLSNFYQGPWKLDHETHLAVGDSGKNDKHFLVYEPKAQNKAEQDKSNKRTKNFRDMHVQNLISALRLKFYVCQDEALAKQLGLDTTRPGDVYLIRQTGTMFTENLKPNISVCDYPFSSELFIKGEDLEDKQLTRQKVNQHALNSPLIIEDDIQLTSILMQFGSYNILAAYCNPKDQETY